MQSVTVPLGDRTYKIHVGRGLLRGLGNACAELNLGHRCAVISDAKVAPHYAQAALRSLSKAGFEPFLITVPSGESAMA